jgi:hypothetical protein
VSISDTSNKTWSQRFRERSHPLLVFLDAMLALLALIALSVGVWLLVVGMGIVAFFLGGADFRTLATIPVYGVPAAVVAYGVLKAKPGFILAPIALAVLISILADATQQQDRAEIAAFPTSELASASRAHQVLALEGAGIECDEACHRIIATSAITLAKKDRYSDWVLFRRAESCADEAQALSTLDFLRQGYRGVCAARTAAKIIGDALILRARAPHYERNAPLSDRFGGRIYEIIERIGGQEQLLGRRIVGSLAPPFPYVIGTFGRPVERIDLGPKINSKDIDGKPIDDRTFLALATGQSVDALYAAAPALPFAEQLDEVERYFDSSSAKVADQAVGVWRGIASNHGRSHQSELRERIDRMLKTDDLRRLRAALDGLHALRPADQAFAQDRILELAWSPLLTTTYASLFTSVRSLLGWPAEPFPAALRERAKARMVDDAPLTLPQRQLLFMLLVRGGAQTRREAVDALFSLEGLAFEDQVRAIRDGESDVWASNQPQQWSADEIDRLIARAPGVPNERLNRFLDAFRFGHFVSPQQKALLVEQVGERLRAAQAAPSPDETLIKQLQRLIEIIPRNISS